MIFLMGYRFDGHDRRQNIYRTIHA